MSEALELTAYLARWADKNPAREAVSATVDAIARACITIDALVRKGPLADLVRPAPGTHTHLTLQTTISV